MGYVRGCCPWARALLRCPTRAAAGGAVVSRGPCFYSAAPATVPLASSKSQGFRIAFLCLLGLCGWHGLCVSPGPRTFRIFHFLGGWWRNGSTSPTLTPINCGPVLVILQFLQERMRAHTNTKQDHREVPEEHPRAYTWDTCPAPAAFSAPVYVDLWLACNASGSVGAELPVGVILRPHRHHRCASHKNAQRRNDGKR